MTLPLMARQEPAGDAAGANATACAWVRVHRKRSHGTYTAPAYAGAVIDFALIVFNLALPIRMFHRKRRFSCRRKNSP